MWTTITYGWYWCSKGVFPPYPFMINHSCQLQQLYKQHGNIQISGFIPTLHVDVRRPEDRRVVTPKTTRALFSCGKGHVEMKGEWFSWKNSWCLPVFKSHVQQKGFRINFQYLRPWNVTSRTEKTCYMLLQTLKGSRIFSCFFRGPCVRFRSYRRPDDSDSPLEHKPLDPKTMKNESSRPQIYGS